MHSLHWRLLLVSSFILVLFLSIIGLVLDEAFSSSIRTSMKDRLQTHVHSVLAVADMDEQGVLKMPNALVDPRLSSPSSGLYAWIEDQSGLQVWRSDSCLGLNLTPASFVTAGLFDYAEKQLQDKRLYRVRYGLVWEDDAGKEHPFNVIIAEDLRFFSDQLSSFRQYLFSWFIAMAILLLLIQAMVLRWGLTPLRKVSQDIMAIKSGEVDQLQGDYPDELQGLTANLNALITHNKHQQTRYRDTLGNLAHSLKTPLAIMQAETEKMPAALAEKQAVSDQLAQINQIVRYQLQRASNQGQGHLLQSVRLKPLLKKICRAMDKVYHQKQMVITLDISEELTVNADEGDLLELFGNLIENACKYGVKHVAIDACLVVDGLKVVINDDGPGIPENKRLLAVQRGQRLDEKKPGQGIGLSVCAELVHVYQGQLSLGQAPTGGLSVQLQLPI